jgi:O-antigen/teichoic acid export membrane protein
MIFVESTLRSPEELSKALPKEVSRTLPPQSRSRSVHQNVVASFSSWIVSLIGAVLCQPIFVHFLGSEKYGIYLLAMSVVVQLTSLNLNVGRALTRKLSIALVADGNAQQKASINDILQTSFCLCLLLALVSALAMAGSARWIAVHVLKIQPSLETITIVALYIGSAAVAATVINQFAASIPQALQRFDLYAYVTIGVSVATSMGNCVLAIAGLGVQSLILWAVVVSVASSAVLWLKSKPLLPKMRWRLSLNCEVISAVVRFGGAVTMYGALGSLISLAERVTVSRYCGTSAVAYYSVPMLMGTYIHGATSALTLVVFPLASQAVALRDIIRLKGLYTRAFKYIAPLIAFAATLSIVGGNAALAVWMGPGFAEHAKDLFGIDALTYGVMAFGIIPWQVIESMGYPSWNAKLSLVWAAVAIPVMVLLTPRIGIRGAALARLVSVAFTFPYMYLVEKRAFGGVLWSFWKRSILATIGASVVAGFALHLLLRIYAGKWFSMGAAGAVSSTVFVGVLYASGLWGKTELSDIGKLLERFKGDKRSDASEEV